jgi:putative pyruvate formate lyase activating enzyme
MAKELGYHRLYKSGQLKKRTEDSYQTLAECTICPRECKVNRLAGERGYCKGGKDPAVSSIGPHFGEESPLVGRCGSGTIFLTHCNLRCVYCQNFEISHFGQGREVSCEQLAKDMLTLQRMGCHNINLVTPTHFVPQILASLPMAIEGGLNIPLVYNCGGYESMETLKLLDGIIEIYMPDIKYSKSSTAKEYSNAPDYFEVAKRALIEMHSQVGDLVIEDGIARRGLLIRHLVLPNDLAGTEKVMGFIAKEVSKNSYVNIMAQYRPEFRASEYPPLNRPITPSEYNNAIELAHRAGLYRLDRDKSLPPLARFAREARRARFASGDWINIKNRK